MAYVTESELEKYIKRSLTSDESDTFDLLEEAARAVVNNYCDTNWDEVTEASRYYDGGEQEISIHPCHSVSEVEVGGSVFQETAYTLEPINKDVKWSIRRATGFPSGIGNIKITAKFSSNFDGIPAEVKLAVIKLMTGILQKDFKSESIEGYSYTLQDQLSKDEEVKGLLSKHRQVYV